MRQTRPRLQSLLRTLKIMIVRSVAKPVTFLQLPDHRTFPKEEVHRKEVPHGIFFIPMQRKSIADHVQYQQNCYNGNEEKCNWQNGGRNTTNIRLHLSNYHTQQFKELQSEKNKTC
jgi:hypothetical protein